MCVCIQCFWEWLVQHLKKKPIIRYEQVPFDIDDHVEEELVQETTRLLVSESESDDMESFNEDSRLANAHVNEMSIELTTQSQTNTPYVTAESTDNDSDSSSDGS